MEEKPIEERFIPGLTAKQLVAWFIMTISVASSIIWGFSTYKATVESNKADIQQLKEDIKIIKQDEKTQEAVDKDQNIQIHKQEIDLATIKQFQSDNQNRK